jgi:hypothetical protein
MVLTGDWPREVPTNEKLFEASGGRSP